MTRRALVRLGVWAPLAALACEPAPAWTEDGLPPVAPGPLRCGPAAQHEAGRCAERCGEFRIEFEQLDGDCGERPTQTTRLAHEPVAPPYPCKGTLTASDNRCSSAFDIRCPVKDDSGTTLGSMERGQLVWTADGNAASGTLELGLFHANGEPKCRSSYQTRVRKL